MLTASTLLFVLLAPVSDICAPGAAPTPSTLPMTPVQGGSLTCCASASGQQCCAEVLTTSGQPLGCSCGG